MRLSLVWPCGRTDEQEPIGALPAEAFLQVVAITANRADPFESRWVLGCDVAGIDVHGRDSQQLSWSIATEARNGFVNRALREGAVEFVSAPHSPGRITRRGPRRGYTVTVGRWIASRPADDELIGSQPVRDQVSPD